MRIVLATAFPDDPATPRGGVEGVSVVLAQALARNAALDIHVVTADDTRETPVQRSWGNVTVHRFPWRARRLLQGATGGAARALRGYISGLEPDVVHAHDTYGIMVDALPCPRVLTIHGFIHADTRISGERLARIRSHVWRAVETRSWARYPHIISISPYVRERLRGIAGGSIHNIDNPIADVFFDVPRAETEPRVLCAATISPRKNTLALIEAVELLVSRGVPATLVLAGPQPIQAYAEAVRQRIQRPDLQGRVVLLPHSSTEVIRSELSRASVAALVSLEENAPLTVQEAMAAGVPVVASNRCGMPYQISDGETGYLVDPEAPSDIADRLELLLRDVERRARFGALGATVARERFHPAVVARRTAEVYERAAGGTTNRPPVRRAS